MAESGPTSAMRETLREHVRVIRHLKRGSLIDKRRGIELEDELDKEISADDVRIVAHALRKRGVTDVKLLNKLQKGLLQGPDRVSAFLATDGALSALVKELSGLNPVLELKAAYCLCNLALNCNGRAAAKLSKTTAAYLLVHMEGMNPLMQDACAWVVGNLAAGGRHSWSVLRGQAVIPKLLHLLASPHTDVVTAAIYALSHFLHAGLHDIKEEELKIVAQHVASLMDAGYNVSRLLFLLSTCVACDTELYAAGVTHKSIARLSHLILTCDLSMQINLCEVTLLVRTVANFVCSESSSVAFSIIESLSSSPSILLTTLLSDIHPHLRQETLWMLANLFKHSSEDVRGMANALMLPRLHNR